MNDWHKQILMLITILGAALALLALTSAKAQTVQQECPAPTEAGVYFERGIGKDGNIICGFQYYNECPYASGYSADDEMCQKFEQQQIPQVKAETMEVSNDEVQAQPEGK